MKLALVTCARIGGLDPDDEPLAEALRRRGAEVEAPVWDDPAVDWSRFAAACLRSTWDYHLRREAFLSWLASAERKTRMAHASSLVRWNSHKGYLGKLQERGAPVIPTVFLPAGRAVDLRALLAERGWAEAVVKPTVGLDSYGVLRATPDTLGEAQARLDEMLAEREVMVQPYMASVVEPGERFLVHIDGHLSHAVRKRSAFLGGRHVGPEGLGVPIADDEREVAAEVLTAAGRELAAQGLSTAIRYARVDMARDERGQPLLMELELTEPTLFFLVEPKAAEAMADMMMRLGEGQ